MDRHNTKRPRESSSSSSSSSSSASADVSYEQFSSPEIGIGNGKKQHVDGGGQEQPPSRRSFDLDLSFGVFDFPWLKDSLISKSEDWKFEDVFFTSLNGTSTVDTLTAFTELSGQLLWCNLPDPWAEEYEAEAHAPPPLEGGGDGLCLELPAKSTAATRE